MNRFSGRAIWGWGLHRALGVLFFSCAACTVEPVAFGPQESLIRASGVELELAMVNGEALVKGKKLIAGNGNRWMRLEGDASVTLRKAPGGRLRALRRPIFSARANRIEIDVNTSIIELKGDVHTRFAGYVRTDEDAGL